MGCNFQSLTMRKVDIIHICEKLGQFSYLDIIHYGILDIQAKFDKNKARFKCFVSLKVVPYNSGKRVTEVDC